MGYLQFDELIDRVLRSTHEDPHATVKLLELAAQMGRPHRKESGVL
jgi:hypothetical protein